MAKVLMINTLNEYPTRATIWNLLNSFRRYSNHKLFYYNLFKFKIPKYLHRIEFDVIIFHQTVTLCGDRERYRRMINLFNQSFRTSKAKKVALFQDEYFNTDMSVEFINSLKIDYVFTVSPYSEWEKIYEGIRKEAHIFPMLTGYINKKSNTYYKKKFKQKRTIDIGYRVVWNKVNIVLGEFGYEKIKIANLFLTMIDQAKYKMDIKVGVEHLIKGRKWSKFLSSCRFVLGVESGSGALDKDGSIRLQILEELKNNPKISDIELYEKFVRNIDGNLNLKALSPRHFEAIESGTCQILYEGYYNGILVPYKHYLPLKKDHSNIKEIERLLSDEDQRLKIVKQAFNDIVANNKYSYSSFVKYFYDKIGIKNQSSLTIKEQVVFIYNYLIEKWTLFLIFIITLLKKSKMINRFKNKLSNKLIAKYYLIRGDKY